MPKGGRRACWKCGEEYEPEVRICVRCGVDLDTGERIETRMGEEEDRLPMHWRLLAFVANWMPGILRPVVIVAAAVGGLVGFALIGFGMFLVFGLGGVFTGVAVAAGGLIAYAQAVAWLLVGRLGIIHDVLADMEDRKWPVFFLMVFAPPAALLVLAGSLRH